ncbi:MULTISPECIES: hypothetical protein [unclassified Streptomyces]|nr:hypothetical protein [Streptomyces sp. BK340]
MQSEHGCRADAVTGDLTVDEQAVGARHGVGGAGARGVLGPA